MADPAFYQQAGDEISRCASRLKGLEQELRRAYGRWEELEGKRE
jgi:ATP-binding cassette subfamily F protein uup